MKADRCKLLGYFCAGSIAVAFVYGIVLPFMWGNNPLESTGTLSLLCETDDRKIFFWIWGILTTGSIVLNTQYVYKRYSYRNRFFDVLCVLAVVSVCVVALTLGHSIENWNPKRIAHWVATGMYIAFTMAPLLLFFLTHIKKYKGFRLMSLIVVLILGTFAFIFIFVGKCGLMEMVPVALVEIFLFVINFVRKPQPSV